MTPSSAASSGEIPVGAPGDDYDAIDAAWAAQNYTEDLRREFNKQTQLIKLNAERNLKKIINAKEQSSTETSFLAFIGHMDQEVYEQELRQVQDFAAFVGESEHALRSGAARRPWRRRRYRRL